MELKETLRGFHHFAYLKMSRTKRRSLGIYAHHSFDELPPNLQYGILRLINGLNQTQKMVGSYEHDIVHRAIKDVGIKIGPFYKACNIPQSCCYTRMSAGLNEEHNTSIRLELIKRINRLFEYVLSSYFERDCRSSEQPSG